MGTVTITHVGGNQYKVDPGDGHDIATKNGLALEGTSEGIPFRILVNGSNLTMELLGTAFDLVRISEQPGNQENSSFAKSQIDPFAGTFEISKDNTIFGNVTIVCTGGMNYQLSTKDGVDLARREGNQLNGIGSDAQFSITTNGNDLLYSYQGGTIQLRRIDATQNVQSTSASIKIDQRLLAVWRSTESYSSGSAYTMVTEYRIGFKKDGTWNFKKEWVGMGQSGEDPQEFGQYKIVSMNDSGGIINLGGKDTEYFFFGKSVKIGSRSYDFMRK